MRYVETIIVGGGPGGSSSAWELQRHGRECLVLERKPMPRLKLCAGWVTPKVLADLANAEVVAALTPLLNDSSPRVRETVEQSLDAIQKRGLQPTQRAASPWRESQRVPFESILSSAY